MNFIEWLERTVLMRKRLCARETSEVILDKIGLFDFHCFKIIQTNHSSSEL